MLVIWIILILVGAVSFLMAWSPTADKIETFVCAAVTVICFLALIGLYNVDTYTMTKDIQQHNFKTKTIVVTEVAADHISADEYTEFYLSKSGCTGKDFKLGDVITVKYVTNDWLKSYLIEWQKYSQ